MEKLAKPSELGETLVKLDGLLLRAAELVPEYEFFEESQLDPGGGGTVHLQLEGDDFDFDDIKEHNDSLLDLATYIEDSWSAAPANQAEVPDQPQMESLELAETRNYKHYREMVIKLFPRVDKVVAETLAEIHGPRWQYVITFYRIPRIF